MVPDSTAHRGDGSSVPPARGRDPIALARRAVALADEAVNRVVLLALLLMLSLGLYCLYDSAQVYASADAAQYSAYRPETDESLSFAQLRAMNGEVIGWLTVNDTPIDYPIVRGPDNRKYMDTTVEGEYRLSGSIFLDYRNDRGFTDFNSILFGHHMEQERMFGSLSEFGDRAYFDAHPFGGLYLREDWSGDTAGTAGFRSYGLEFFAVLLADAYDAVLYEPAVQGAQRQVYLDHLLAQARFTRPMDVGPEDRLVLLSTCTTERTNGRYVLVGKRTDTLHPQTEPPRRSVLGTGVDALRRWPGILFWFVAALVLRTAAVLHRRAKRRASNNEAPPED